jgi:predicted nuclease of predicted toxin-antitoxin system
MKIKLDENIPAGVAGILNGLGHDTDTVPQERLAGRDGRIVWEAAQQSERFLITQDLDFSDLRRFVPGSHHGLLLIRLRRPGPRRLTQARREPLRYGVGRRVAAVLRRGDRRQTAGETPSRSLMAGRTRH